VRHPQFVMPGLDSGHPPEMQKAGREPGRFY
jgi:hypothetical protein